MHLTTVFYMEASFEVGPETSRLDDNISAVQIAACCAFLGSCAEFPIQGCFCWSRPCS